MEENNVQTITSHHRPRTQHSTNFRRLPSIKDSRDYIIITQEILDSFKDKVVKSHKINLKLNHVRLKGSRHPHMSRRTLPQVAAETPPKLCSKAHTCLDLREHVRRRPVKVFVDDITKQSTENFSEVTSDSGQGCREISKRRTIFIKSSSNMVDKGMKRSMESGEEDGEFPDNIIETVARANTMYVSHAPVLPEIRAAPCPIHTKQNHRRSGNEETNDALVETVKDIKALKKSRQTHPIKTISMQQNSDSHDHVTRNRVDINVRMPEQYQAAKSPSLPKHMSSKDYVMTWLIHGSAPQGSNHFPEILPGKTKSKTKYTPRNHYTDE